MTPTALISIIAISIMAFIFHRIFARIFKQFKNRKRLMNEGDLTVAYVESIAQTGVTINQQPEMRMLLQIENSSNSFLLHYSIQVRARHLSCVV